MQKTYEELLAENEKLRAALIGERQVWRPKHGHPLLDRARTVLNAKTDRALAKTLGVQHSLLSKMRHGGIEATPTLMIAVHEKAGIPFKEIRELLGQAPT